MALEIVSFVEQHPVWIIGGVVGLGGLFYLMSRSSGSQQAAGQNFTFSYGPSDAQVQAGTALAISQAQDQTAVSLAQISAGTAGQEIAAQGTAAGQYFNYLTTNSANQLAATQNTNATAQAVDLGTAADQLAAVQNTNATQLATTNVNDSTARGITQANDLNASEYNTIEGQVGGLSTYAQGLGSAVSGLSTYTQGLGSAVSGLGTYTAGLGQALGGINSQVSGLSGQVAGLSSQVGSYAGVAAQSSSTTTLAANLQNALVAAFPWASSLFSQA